jgi:ArsR family metal-binding transcriptional regulator
MDEAFQYYEIHGLPELKLVATKGKVTPLLYDYLPKINCNECGERGYFPFAAKLASGEKPPT